mgnify:CR=1 FL=1
MNKMVGKQSVSFSDPPCILGAASICGPKEAEGPLADYFDIRSEDPTFGKNSWEEGESEMIRQAVELAIKKADKKKKEIRYIFAGDLLGQLIATTFGIKDLDIPVFGLYGACSTCGEGLSLASMTVAAGYADCVVAATSFWKCRETVPVSTGIWKSETVICDLDGNRKWSVCCW